MRFIAPVVSIFLVLTCALPAIAAATDDAATCGDRQVDDAERMTACTRAIESGALSAPELSMAHFGRAKVLERRGELERALADWDAAIRMRPDAAILYIERGSLLLEMKDLERAGADLDQALRLDPNSRLAHFWRAALHMARDAVEARLARPQGEEEKGDEKIGQPQPPAVEPQPPAEQPKAADAQPAEEKKCISVDTEFKRDGKEASFVIALTNNCERRTRCTVNAYVVNSFGPNTGRAVLTLAEKSKGAAAHKSYVMKVKQAGGMASVSHSCSDL